MMDLRDVINVKKLNPLINSKKEINQVRMDIDVYVNHV